MPSAAASNSAAAPSAGHAATPAPAAHGGPTPPRRPAPWAAVAGVALLCVLAVLASLLLGARLLDPGTAFDALGSPDSGTPESVIMQNRLRRTVTGLVVGAALACAGAALQGVTRNPLGDPGILGINAGATCAVVVGLSFFGAAGIGALGVWAMVGSALAAVLVYSIASVGRGGPTPIKLALVGAALAAGVTSVTSALMLQRQETLDSLRRWQIGALGRSGYEDLLTLTPMLLLGLVLTVGLCASVNNFALGDDMARALGERVALKRGLIFAGVTMLCALAVALAGPIAFVGLMVPHALRAVVGPDYRWILPLCLLAGPAMLLIADVVGRLILPPSEVQVGVTMAVVGVPVFILLIRSRKAMDL